jgi:activator of HSP90 ATPase
VSRRTMQTRRQMIANTALAVGSVALCTADLWAADEISRTNEAIHQEIVFKASRKRVYETLTDAAWFAKVVQLSAAMQSGMAPGAKPVELSRVAGGAFSLFAGHIVGRHIELVPDERVIQAWRVSDWSPGVYSIARFELSNQGSGCKLSLDHTGFPKGKGEYLAQGWKSNYWEPMEKCFANNI